MMSSSLYMNYQGACWKQANEIMIHTTKEIVRKRFEITHALGGGEVTEALVNGLGSNSWVHVYGYLEAKPFTLQVALS